MLKATQPFLRSGFALYLPYIKPMYVHVEVKNFKYREKLVLIT